MKKIKKILIAVAASIPFVVSAEVQYRLSAPIPGLEKVEGATPFFAYLQNLIPFLLGATAILAMVVVTIGGVQYVISGGNESQRSDAKSRIWHAIGGLTLAAVSWIILNTINPDLVKLRLPLKQVGVSIESSRATTMWEKYESCKKYRECLVRLGATTKEPKACNTLGYNCNIEAINGGDCVGRGPFKFGDQCDYTAECNNLNVCAKTKSSDKYKCVVKAAAINQANHTICP